MHNTIRVSTLRSLLLAVPHLPDLVRLYTLIIILQLQNWDILLLIFNFGSPLCYIPWCRELRYGNGYMDPEVGRTLQGSKCILVSSDLIGR